MKNGNKRNINIGELLISNVEKYTLEIQTKIENC